MLKKFVLIIIFGFGIIGMSLTAVTQADNPQQVAQPTFTRIPTITPTPLQVEEPAAPEATPTPSGPLAFVVGARGLAVRSGPYIGASRLRIATPEQGYPVSARNNDEGVYTWYRITLPSGVTGWASGKHLEFNFDPATLPVAGSVFDTIPNPPDTDATVITQVVLNFRTRPSYRMEDNIMDEIWAGTELPLLGRTVEAGGNYWFQVRYEDRVGWIRARRDYTVVRGDLDSVPIR